MRILAGLLFVPNQKSPRGTEGSPLDACTDKRNTIEFLQPKIQGTLKNLPQ